MLPGSKTRPDAGALCIKCQKPAHCKVCVEADSFGEEYDHLCLQHTQEFDDKKKKRLETPCHCDWCKNDNALGVVPFRDPDEGCNGPIYRVCETCRQKHIKKFLRVDIGQHEVIRRMKDKQNKELLEEVIDDIGDNDDND